MAELRAPARRPVLADLDERAAAAGVAGQPYVRLRELAFLGQVDLRLDAADTSLRAAAEAALGLPLPLDPGTASSAAGRSLLWLGPDWWLVVDASPGSIESALERALAGMHHSTVDVSAARTCLELTGPRARAVLETGCALDLHPRSFGAGRCAQTLLARAQVVLHQVDDAPAYRIFVRSSFAGYLADWLLDAMTEYAG